MVFFGFKEDLEELGKNLCDKISLRGCGRFWIGYPIRCFLELGIVRLLVELVELEKMAGSDERQEGETSPPLKRTRNASKRSKEKYHDISDSASEGDDHNKREKGFEESVGGGGFSTNQMQQFATIISAAMGSAFAQVSSGSSFPPSSHNKDGGALSEDQQESEEEHKEDDEVDDYDKTIDTIIGNQEVVGPEICEKVGRVLEKCLGPALDEKMVKKRESSIRGRQTWRT